VKKTIRIKNIEAPSLSAYRSMNARELEDQGFFVAETERVVQKLLDSKLKTESCLMTENCYERMKPYLSGKDFPVYVGTKKELGKITGFKFYQGALALARHPEKLGIRDVIGRSKKDIFMIAFNSVTDPQNVGLILRSASAFGCTAVIADRRTCDPYYRKAARISIGTVFNMPVAYEDDLVEVLKYLRKEKKTKVIVTTPAKTGRSIEEVSLTGNVCIVMGNEEEGAERPVMDEADLKIRIPMQQEVIDSLNVACAGTIALYKVFLARKGQMK